MKKSLIALAVLGAFSGAALAQSNVTLYGILDVNWQYTDPDGDGTSSTKGINGGHQSGNRFGLRGSEALGGGWNAVFTIEGGFNIDTGTSGQASNACGGVPVAPPGNLNPCGGASQLRLFGRQAWAGLESGFGTFVAGRVASVTSGTGSFDMMGFIDPFGTGFGDANLGRTFSSLNSLRLDNAVLYQTPVWSGFRGGANYSFNLSGSENASSGNNVKVWSVAGTWTGGPFQIGVSYDSFDVPGAQDKQTHLMAGGTWDFKIAKLHAGYASETNVNGIFTSVGAPSLPSNIERKDADAWTVGATVPVFGGNLLLSYQDRNGDAQPTNLAGTTFDERDVSIWSIGYTYPLSRRTNLYASYASSDGDQTLKCNSVTVAGGCPAGSGTSGSAYDRSQFTIGMRHLF